MAVMTEAQRVAELARKKRLGLAPTDQANVAQYNKLAVDPVKAQAMQTVKTQPAVAAAPVTLPQSRTETTLGTINQAVTADPFKFTAPETFVYNKDTDPAYAAAVQSAQANIAQQQADTGAALRANGQGRSSYSEAVAQQIGAKEMARVSTDVLPALIDKAYARYADTANRDLQVQQANYGVDQDRIANLANVYGLQRQQDFLDPLTEAQTTGQYLSGEARQYIAAIQALKQQAEAPGITATARAGLSQQADAYRAALQGLGVDSSLFGAGVSLAGTQGNIGKAGTATLAAQGQRFNQDVTAAGLTGVYNGKQTVQEQQRQFGNDLATKQFDETKNVNQREQDRADLVQKVNEEIARGNLSVAQGQLVLSQDDNDRAWAQLDWQMSQEPAAGAKGGMSANDVLSNIKSIYTEPVFAPSGEKDMYGNAVQKQTGTQITTDPGKREQMFLNVVDSGLSDLETNQVLAGLGMTKQEIEQYKKKYPAAASPGE